MYIYGNLVCYLNLYIHTLHSYLAAFHLHPQYSKLFLSPSKRSSEQIDKRSCSNSDVDGNTIT